MTIDKLRTGDRILIDCRAEDYHGKKGNCDFKYQQLLEVTSNGVQTIHLQIIDKVDFSRVSGDFMLTHRELTLNGWKRYAS